MQRPVFPQNVIAMVWDFDKTLIPGNMQGPIFAHFGVDEAAFWEEVDGLDEYYTNRGASLIGRDHLYLHHFLTYVREGRMAGLSNQILRELGGELEFYEGIPAIFESLSKTVESDPRFAEHQIRIEHYVVSTGLRQMILGSRIAPHLTDVWGCEFVEEIAPPGYLDINDRLFNPDPEIRQLIYAIDNTAKTRALFEINKGTNKNPSIDVNAKIAREDRRIPFPNMVYVADGPSDVPVFSVVDSNGGRTLAVYKPGSTREFEQANRLLEQGRINAVGEADYSEGAYTAMWLHHTVDRIANRILEDRETTLSERVGLPPRHLSD
ncbi:MAG: haloacid dehalogenase-like hydrolase [Acidimicrobiia bacterium]|nr:haloacid dehalogenase-like hydrolase [Acidimicrobiia bacterium]